MLFKKSLTIVLKKLNSPHIIPEFLNKNHFPSLDGWRAVAIILVIFGHSRFTTLETSLYNQFIFLLVYASLGVKIFFVLSGFLITSLLIKEFIKNEKINIKHFFIKRTLRIFPVLYLYILTIFILNYIYDLNLKIDYFLGPLLYISNFSIFEGTWITGHTWSLAVEEQFYLVWPFIFSFMTLKAWLFCTIILCSVPLLNIWWYYNPSYYQITLGPFLTNADSIFTGSLFAILSFQGFFNKEQKIWFNKIIILFAIFIILAIYYFISRGMLGKVLVPFGSITVNLLIVFLLLQSIINNKTIIYRFLNKGFMIKIGAISYSLYIWQQLFILPLNIYSGFSKWSIFPLNILLSFLMAYLSYNYFEKYFLNMKTKLTTNSI